MSGGVRSLWTSVGRMPFHPLVGSPHVPAMDAGPERYELRQQRRVRARGVLRVLLAERSGGYRFLQNRESGVEGKRVDLGGRRIIKKKKRTKGRTDGY